MKTSLSILLIFINTTWIIAQNKVLIDFSYKSFMIENSSINSCILSDTLIDDMRKIIIFSRGECNKPQGFANITNDTLVFSFGVPSVVDTQYTILDSLTGKIMIYEKMRASGWCCNGYCGYELTYLLDKKYSSAKIRMKNDFISKCTDRPDFQIMNGDTINRLDKFGLKQGEWIEFYPDQKIKNKDRYINGRLIYGYGYDKLGNIISRTSREGEITITRAIEVK